MQMKVTPVIAIHIPFGGDNHHDAALASGDGADGRRRGGDRAA